MKIRELHSLTSTSISQMNQTLSGEFGAGELSILITSPDTSISDEGIATLAMTSEKYPGCILGCRTVDAEHPERVQLPGWQWSTSDGRWTSDWMIELKADPGSLDITACEALSPEAVVIPNEAWLKIGPFDTNLTAKHAVFDWCRRAYAAGFPCLEVRDARALTPHAITQNYDARVQAYLVALPDTLHIAKTHGLPLPRFRLLSRLLHHAITEEISRVRFGADYGFPISKSKRTIWYFRNVANALTRERVLSTLRHALLCYLPGFKSQIDR